MNEPAPHLHRVSYDATSGELCPNCEEMQKQLDGAERDVRAWRARYADLAADRAKKAEGHRLFPEARRAHAHWQIVCNHKRSPFTTDRFWILQPFLEDAKHYGLAKVLRAIDGAAFEPFVTQRAKTGTWKRHDGFPTIFKHSDAVEEYANRAPSGWTVAVSKEMEHWAQSSRGLVMPKGWQPPPPESDGGQTELAEPQPKEEE